MIVYPLTAALTIELSVLTVMPELYPEIICDPEEVTFISSRIITNESGGKAYRKLPAAAWVEQAKSLQLVLKYESIPNLWRRSIG
jgi:hypothetical protein